MGIKGQIAWNKIKIDEKELMRLYLHEKKSAKEVSEIFGVGVGVIYSRLKELNITRTNSQARIKKHPANYRGWYIEKKSGYKIVVISEIHPFASMGIRFSNNHNSLYVREHRLVMAEHLGRPLERWEVVHHKNHIKLDNRIENLELFSGQSQHHAETITHIEMLKMKSEIQRLRKENIRLKDEINSRRAALLAVMEVE